MTLHPQTSDRNRGETREQALQAMQDLGEQIHNALGAGGKKALERICQVAPGTYFHSQNIMEMMPARWQEADYQAAVLLHDLGKVHYAPYYAENFAGESQRPDPAILHSHVDGGSTLADFYSLPPLARDAISEHHGTMTTVRTEAGENILPYRGQKPRSMFTAVLMMTDKIEAIKSSNKLSEELIWHVYDDCIAQEQFEHVDEQKLRVYVTQVLNQALEMELEPDMQMPVLESDQPEVSKPKGPALEGMQNLSPHRPKM